MARVLVVDDDNLQSMTLGLSLTAKKHVVEMASTGADAIRMSVRMQPDILVVDWLLGQSLNGIRVARAVRAVHPSCHSILLTGFPAQDVRTAALEAKFFGFFSKPVSLDKLHAAIDKAASTAPLAQPRSIGFARIDDKGKIVHINDRAKFLLKHPDSYERAAHIEDLFTYKSGVSIRTADGEWAQLTLKTEGAAPVLACVTPIGGDDEKGRFLFALSIEERDLLEDETVRDVVRYAQDSTEQVAKSSRYDSHVLLIDENDLQRRLASMLLQKLGCVFHAAESHERALQILESDPLIRLVLVDYGKDGAGLGELARRIRRLQEAATMVGISSGFRRREFEEVGIDRCLQKPLASEAIEELLESRRAHA